MHLRCIVARLEPAYGSYQRAGDVIDDIHIDHYQLRAMTSSTPRRSNDVAKKVDKDED